MTAETLNFGPEWLRALSRGASVTSPPPSPAMPKSKLADYRYGREEMLALYVKDNKIPEDMQDKEFAAILQDEPQQPLALVPLTEEEQELIMKFLQQSQQQSMSGSSGWSGSQTGALSLGKATGKSMGLLELEAERIHKQQQQRAQQQQRHGGLTMGQWNDGPSGMWSGSSMDGKVGGGNPAMGMWDEAMKNQSSHRNIGLRNSRSSPSLSDQYMLNRRKRTDEEERLLKLLQGMKPQDGFTTWCEQMLHALNTSANNASLDVPTIVAYLKEVESPYEVHDFIRIYLGDTIEAKEFAKQFLERRAKQKANHQRQQQQVSERLSKEVSGLNMNFPLQSMFQAAHISYSFLGGGELEQVEDY